MAKSDKKARKSTNEPEVLVIQFITDDTLLIPGTGSVGVRGQFLDIGPGKTGAEFPYRSPEEQVRHYGGEQKYILIAAYDKDGVEIDHPDIERTVDGSDAFVPETEAADEPAFQNRGTNTIGGEEETTKKKKSSKKSSEKKSEKGGSKKSSSKSKSKKNSK